MPPTERDTRWVYPLLETSQDKRSSRLAVKPPYSYELIGVDGQFEGGLRPFPGFKKAWQFNKASDWGSNHDTTSDVTDVHPFEVACGEDGEEYAYGFVYRVRRKNGATGTSACDVFIDYYNSVTGGWSLGGSTVQTTVLTLYQGVPLPPDLDTENGLQMDVAVSGRLLYVYLEKRPAALFYLDQESPYTKPYILGGNYGSRTPVGPGLQPTLIAPEKAGSLGSLLPANQGDPDRYGYGQVILTDYLPSEVGLNLGNGTSTSGEEGRIGQDDEAPSMLEPGDYAFAFMLHDTRTGRWGPLSKVAYARTIDFAPVLSSGYSPTESEAINLYAAIEICYDNSLYDQAYVYRSVKVQDAGGTLVAAIMHLDRIIDLDEFLTNNNTPSGPFDTDVPGLRQAVYWYELEDKQLVYQMPYVETATYDTYVPEAGAGYWFDGTMVVSKITQRGKSSEVENQPFDSIRGVGEIRWSTMSLPGPELFPPSYRYTPSLSSNDVMSLEAASPNIVGVAQDRLYLIRKAPTGLDIREMHKGFGAVGPMASESVGSLVYFMTEKGLKAVDSNGQLDAVNGMNSVALDRWANDLNGVSMALDPLMSSLFVHHPNLEETIVFWFNSARVTELRDAQFRQVVRGPWPQDFGDVVTGGDVVSYHDDFDKPLTERALFLRNMPWRNTASTTNPSNFPELWVVDYTRERTHEQGSQSSSSQHTMYSLFGDSVFSVATDFDSGTDLQLKLTGGKKVPWDCDGVKIYVLKSADETLLGASAVIHNVVGSWATADTVALTAATASNLYGLDEDDIVGMSPIYFQWTGSPVGLNDEEGNQFGSLEDFFRIRHAKSIGCAFTDVDLSSLGTADQIGARYTGLVYRGAEDAEVEEVQTRDLDGNLVTSLVDHEATYYAGFGTPVSPSSGRHGVDGSVLVPGIRILCPDVDYRLVGVVVDGSIRATFRRVRAS